MSPINRAAGPPAELIVAHSSDLHLGARSHGDGDIARLHAVIAAAHAAGAHALVLAGDIFDSNRVHDAIVDAAALMLAAAAFDVVILPGNHDPATPDSVYRRPAMSALANVHILGIGGDGEGGVCLPHLDLEVSGAPHMDYADMPALAVPRTRSLRWHIVVAHGHWVTGPQDAHRGWLIHDHEIVATGADYVALGHWDRALPAGDGTVPAYYSGSPELARAVNIVRLTEGVAQVRTQSLQIGP